MQAINEAVDQDIVTTVRENLAKVRLIMARLRSIRSASSEATPYYCHNYWEF